jgi:methylmalonyl-CoA/ethylmalonyl-CoA epimerase
MPPVPIAGIDHVALVVRDIDAALPWYIDQLGFSLIGDEYSSGAGGVRLTYLDAGNVIIQLVSPTGESGPIAEHLATHGDGLHHICLAVDDIEATVTALAPGADVPVGLGGRGRRTAFLPGKQGGLITELTETAPHAPMETASA